MLRQDDNDTTTLEMVANAQRRGIVRDRVVGALLALGLLIGVTTIESMARSAQAAPVPTEAQAPCADESVMLASALVIDIVQ